MPHFFKYAKDKVDTQIEAPNKSFVNKLENVIPTPRFNFRRLGLEEIEYRFLMHDPDVKAHASFTNGGKIIAEETDPLIVAYHDLTKKYFISPDRFTLFVDLSQELLLMYSKVKDISMRERIVDDVKNELAKIETDVDKVVDALIYHTYSRNRTNAKALLWMCYGDVIYRNMLFYIDPSHKTVKCMDCDIPFQLSFRNYNTHRCPECTKKYKRTLKMIEKQRINAS